MMRLIKSPWFAAVMGMVAFMVTMLLVFKPAIDSDLLQKLAEAASRGDANATGPGEGNLTHLTHHDQQEGEKHRRDMIELKKAMDNIRTSGDPGSLQFDNADIKKLVDGLGRQLMELEERQKRLDDLNLQIENQLKHLASHTNQVALAQADLQKIFEANRELIKRSEIGRLTELAKLNETMMANSMPNTMASLKLNPPNEIARIMFYMAPTNRAVLMNAFASDETDPTLTLMKSVQDSYKKIIIEKESSPPTGTP